MSSPWLVTQRDRVSAEVLAEPFAPDAQPGSAATDDGVPDANLELFSYTRTSWIVPLSASAIIDKL